jgi:hypothetical protein
VFGVPEGGAEGEVVTTLTLEDIDAAVERMREPEGPSHPMWCVSCLRNSAESQHWGIYCRVCAKTPHIKALLDTARKWKP